MKSFSIYASIKYSRFVLQVLLIFVIGMSSLYGQNVNKIIKHIQDTYDDMNNLTASFVQVETFKLTGTQTEVAGKIFIKDGKKYRFESEDQVIVTDGKNVWTYNNISKQLLIDHVRENSGALLPRDLLFKYPKSHYATIIGEETMDGSKVYLIRLDPKEDTSGFLKSIKLWVHDRVWLITKMETTDLGGNSTLILITDLDNESPLADDLFSYEAPENADVIDMRK